MLPRIPPQYQVLAVYVRAYCGVKCAIIILGLVLAAIDLAVPNGTNLFLTPTLSALFTAHTLDRPQINALTGGTLRHLAAFFTGLAVLIEIAFIALITLVNGLPVRLQEAREILPMTWIAGAVLLSLLAVFGFNCLGLAIGRRQMRKKMQI